MTLKDRIDKYCKRCDQTLLIENFGRSKGRYDGVQQYCKECMKLYRIEHYRKDKESHRKRNLKTEARLKSIVWELKNSGSCEDCGVAYPNEPWLFDFDHLPEFEKTRSVSSAIKWGSEKQLLEEIEKCELVCLICHRRRTAQRGGWTCEDTTSMID